MSDDAEWLDVDKEFGVVSAGPSPPRSPTDRPFWLPSTPPPRNRPPNNTPWPPRYPFSTPFTPHEAPELAPPSPPMESTQANLGLVLGLVGGLLGLLMMGLLVYMVLLRRRLSKVQNTRPTPTNDYSLRIEDVAHLSTPLDDSSQLYVNTSDLHKLVSSVTASKKNLPPAAPTEPRGRPMCPIPSETPILPPSDYRRRPKNEGRVAAGLYRLSERFSAINFSGFNMRFGGNTSGQVPGSGSNAINAGYESSMPDIVQIGVPEVLDDEDLWSEDSFDSCSIGYENETNLSTSSRGGSTRRSSRQNQLNRSARSQENANKKRISPPSIPPPPPPTVASASTPSPSSTPGNSGNFGIVRKAPPPPWTAKNCSNEQPTSQGASVTHAAIHVPHNANATHSQFKPQSKFASSVERGPVPSPPSVPKPDKPSVTGKPAPPTAPKPATKPQLRPKLNMALVVPPKGFTPGTPGTATTLLSSTPALEGHPFGSSGARLFEHANQRGHESTEVDTSNLSVSARRALLEGKTMISSGTQRQ